MDEQSTTAKRVTVYGGEAADIEPRLQRSRPHDWPPSAVARLRRTATAAKGNTVTAPTPPTRRVGLVALIAAVVLLVVGAVAFTLWTTQRGSDKVPSSSATGQPAATSPSPTLTSEQAQAAEQALMAYNAYREYQVKAMTTGKFAREEMTLFVGEPLLGIHLHALSTQVQAGVVFHGRPTWNPKVVEIDLANQLYSTVVIDDCFDTTNFTPVFKDGKPVPGPSGSSQPNRMPIGVKVKKVNATWYVYETTPARSSPC